MENLSQVLSLKFKLLLSKDERQELLHTIRLYSKHLNLCLEQNYKDKSINRKTLHDQFYSNLRELFPSQMAINLYRETITIYSNLLRKQKLIKNKNKRSEFFKKIPQRTSSTMQYTLNRDCSINIENHTCSFRTINNRIKNISFLGWNKHYDLLKQYPIGDPKIKYDKSNKNFYLIIPVEIKVKQSVPKELVGIDCGERHCVALVSSVGKEQFYELPENYRKRKTMLNNQRGSLKSKGTRSARRKYNILSSKEQRLTSDCLHKISSTIISEHRTAQFILENLTGIRNKRKTFRKDKEQRRQTEQWAFAQFQEKLKYKSCLHNGIDVQFVEPSYTSQTCPVCGHCAPENRKDELFQCVNCNYVHHADLVGGRNIINKFIGLIVKQPNVQTSDDVLEQAAGL